MTVGECQTETSVRGFVRGRLGSATTASTDSGIDVSTRSYTAADGATLDGGAR